MTEGIRIWGPTAALELDETSFTVGVTYSSIVSRSGSTGRTQFISIAGVDPATHSAVCIPIAAYDTGAQNYESIQYTAIVSSGGVTIYFGSPAANTGPLGTSNQRLLVMRFR